MTSRTFGRRGLDQGAIIAPRPQFGMAPARAEFSPAGEGTNGEDEMAARRAAFIASERARKLEAGDRASPPAEAGRVGRPSATTPLGRPKSLFVAYFIWFVIGQTGAHRFYLGYPTSGLIQASLWVVNILMMVSQSLLALPCLAAAAIWLLADLFLIPGLHRRRRERTEQRRIGEVFD